MLFRLGEELIQDEVQAIAELVKNSYNANARSTKGRRPRRGSLRLSALAATQHRQGTLPRRAQGDMHLRCIFVSAVVAPGYFDFSTLSR